jgi:molybdate transport system substrate-binding protein
MGTLLRAFRTIRSRPLRGKLSGQSLGEPPLYQRTTMPYFRVAVAFVVWCMLIFSGAAHADITVRMSGGFALAYQDLLPEFEGASGIKVVTTSGASQGTGPNTIKAQLERGEPADVVILSTDGLAELIAGGRIADGSNIGLATTPLGAAVRAGTAKPDVGTRAAFTQTLLKARLITMPGSTSGKFIKDTVLPKLGIADKVSVKVLSRGAESTAMLAAGQSDIALGPVSELVRLPGVDYVGNLPAEFQLVQEFSAAIVSRSQHVDEAKKLIAFLTSGKASAAIRAAGMSPVAR